MNRDEALAKLKQWEADWEKGATDGPWHVTHDEGNVMAVCNPEDLVVAAVGTYPEDDEAGNPSEDAAFIALSRTLLPAMVRLGVEELERHEPIDWWCGECTNGENVIKAPCPTVQRWISVLRTVEDHGTMTALCPGSGREIERHANCGGTKTPCPGPAVSR